jgi:anti-sigma factor RsiW
VNDVACAAGVELLMDYLEDALAGDVRATIEEHVAGCPRCQAFIASYRETPAILRRATVVSMPAELSRSLLAVVRGRAKGTPSDADP